VNYNFDEYEAVDLFTDRMVDASEAAAIAEKLKTNTTVRKLLVKSQIIEDRGAFAFAEMLKCNSTLEDLGLRSDTYTRGGEGRGGEVRGEEIVCGTYVM
jgi:hypothetical protein